MSFRRIEDEGVHLVRKSGDARPLKNLMVTGGCGFIGSNFINHFLPAHPGVHIYNIDKMDYCANEKSVEVRDDPRYHFIRGDIGNTDLIMHVMQTYDIDTVVNFAAQSHVDNSFGNSMTFTRSNVFGTHNLLECARVYGKIEKFIHVSTDEVYGEVTSSQGEHAVLNPTNPYAATKAAAEFIAKSYLLSFGLPVIITRGNNVYGKYQYPEKVIPRFAMLLTLNKQLTIQGTGKNTRTFIHASDVAKGFETVILRGIIGEVYNIGSRDEHSVADIARRTVELCKPGDKLDDWVIYVKDRDFNDTRYDIDSSKLHALGWKPEIEFESGFKETVEWYNKVAIPSGFWSDIRMHIQGSEVEHPVAGHH